MRLEQFRKEQGTTGKAWGDLTDAQKRALRDFESATTSTMRAVILEKNLTTVRVREADRRHDALLTKEASLREKLLAEDRRAEDKRIAILAASEASRADIGRREAVARSVIEAEITAKLRTEIKARGDASEAELATIRRVAGLEKEARVRAIAQETEAIVAARHRQAEAEAEAVQHAQAKAGVGHLVTGTAAGYFSAHAMLRPAEAALESGSERQGALIGARRAGMSPAEIVRAQDLAVKVARDVGNMTATQVLELHKEARSAVQHPEEVFELMPDLARAASALKGMGAQGNIADLVKAGESLGLMGNPERFRRFLDSQIRAQGVMGKTVTTEGTYEAAKYTKSAGATLSDEFLNLTLPSLIQELHGSSAGDAIASLTKRLRGGLAHQHLAVTQLDRMGLLEDPSQIHYAKGSGEIMGYTGKVKGDSLLATDPDRWFNEVFKPAAQKNMGARTMADMNMLLSQTLGSTASNLGRIFIQQADTFAQHRENNRNAPGLDEQIRMQREDPKVAAQTFHDALDDLGAAVTGPVMGRVGLGLTDLAGYIRNVEDAALAHPNIALGLGAGATAVGLLGSGWLAYQVSVGFGLPAAAGQLTASAVALETAAGRLGAGNVVKEVAQAAPAAIGTAAPSIALPGAVTLGAGAIGFGTAAALTGLVKESFASQEPGRGGLYAPATAETAASDRQDLADLKVERDDLARKVAEQKAREKLPGMSDAATMSDRDRIAQLDAAIGNKQRSLDALPGFARGGYTGDGGRNEVAGVVHGGEYVFDADQTDRMFRVMAAIRGGNIDASRSTTPSRVALATDSSSAAALRQVVGEGMYDALRRIRNETDALGGSGATGAGDGGGTPNMRYGRGGSGRYRGTPGTGQDYEAGPHVSLGRMGAKFSAKAPVILDGLMKKYGLTREQAAGIVGNLAHESGGFTKYHEGGKTTGEGGVGWAQWTGPRRRAFEAWTQAHGLNPTSDEASWRYLTEGDPETARAIAAVKRESTVHGASHAWERAFERAGVKAYGSRDRFADAAYGMRPGGATMAADTPNGAASTGTVRGGRASAAVDALDKLDGAGSAQAGRALGTMMHMGQWCADAVNGALKVAGIKGSGSSMANSFRDWGKHVDFGDVKRGDVIFEDHGRGRGHAGFATGAVQRDQNGNVVAIGMTSGNHGNRVRRDYMERVGEITDLRRADEEATRQAERAVLPRRAPAGATPNTPSASIGLDHSPILAAIEHVDTLHRKLQGLKGVASVDINHRHRHEGEPGGRAGALRTSLNGGYASDGRAWT